MDWLKWPRRAPISVEDGAPPPSTSGRKKLFAGSSIALALLAVAVCVWMQGERPGWTIVEASDMVRHAGQVPAETGGTVRTGEGLSVGALGKGTLRLKSTGTTLALTPNTSLRFDKAAKRQQVTLLSGAISAEASGLNASNPLVVRVQNSEVEASKAKFSTTITAKGFQLSVEEGEVGMNPGGGKPRVQLAKSEGMDVLANGTTARRMASGSLKGSFAAPPSAVNLSSEGTLDWIHAGLSAPPGLNRKSGIPLLSSLELLSSKTATIYDSNRVAYSWTQGTPQAEANDSPTGIHIDGIGSGFRLQAPAGLTSRTLKVYVSAWAARGKLTASLSDQSAAEYVDRSIVETAMVTGGNPGVYTIVYTAKSEDQRLIVSWVMDVNHEPNRTGTGNITFQAATLSK